MRTWFLCTLLFRFIPQRLSYTEPLCTHVHFFFELRTCVHGYVMCASFLAHSTGVFVHGTVMYACTHVHFFFVPVHFFLENGSLLSRLAVCGGPGAAATYPRTGRCPPTRHCRAVRCRVLCSVAHWDSARLPPPQFAIVA